MLDTKASIKIINGDAAMQARLKQEAPAAVAISTIVHYELAFGVCNSAQPARNQARLDAFLSYIQPVEFLTEHAIAAAELRCELARKGRPIGPHDILIAAHARSVDATLVTHNMREFGRVPGLKVEDWE